MPLLLAGAALIALQAVHAAAPPVSSAASSAATVPQIPVRDFVRRDEFWNPVLSPDGQHIVLNRRVQIDGKDVTVMVVHHLPDMKLLATVRLPVFEVPITYYWLTNKRLAVRTGVEEGSIEKPYFTGEIMAMDIDGEHQQYLYGYKEGQKHGSYLKGDAGWATVTHVPTSHNGHVFVTEHPWSRGIFSHAANQENHSLLYDIDSVSAARHLVAEIDAKEYDFLLDGDDKPRFAFGDDGSAMQAILRFDAASQQWAKVSGEGKANVRPIAFTADGKSFYGSVSSGGGPNSLVRQSTLDDSIQLLAKDDKGSIDIVEMSAAPRTPIATATEVGIPQLRYLDESNIDAKLHKLLNAQFPGDFLRFLNFTDDGQKLLFVVASDRNPGDYYLFDRKTGKADLLFSAASWLDPDRMPRRRPIAFKASDGLELHGYLTLPDPQGEAKPPLILLPHGGPESADGWFFDEDAAFLASRGYAVLQINYRGSAGRGVSFRRAGYRQWGLRMQDDLIEGVRWAVAQGEVDSKRMCVYGGSFGAYSAMMTVARAPDLFKCAVGYSGLYDLPLLYKSDENRADQRNVAYLARAIGLDPNDLQNQSPTRYADKITVPVLLVHGGDDKRTEPNQAYAMRDALTRAGHPPEWMFVAGEGHGFYAEKNRQAFYEKLDAFLAKNLMP